MGTIFGSWESSDDVDKESAGVKRREGGGFIKRTDNELQMNQHRKRTRSVSQTTEGSLVNHYKSIA